MKYIDIHGHINFAAYDNDREEVIKRALDKEVAMITVGTQFETSNFAVELARKYENVYACIGLHPIHTSKSFHDTQEFGHEGKDFTSKGEVVDFERYISMASEKKTVAIGECGLDYYHYDDSDREKQEKAFISMIDLANSVRKPLMLHLRNGVGKSAYKDAYSIIKGRAVVKANLHFLAGNKEEAKPFLDLGYTFSFTGAITYGTNYVDIIKYLPLDRIMTETDCPYVSPVPNRGKRNEPVNVIEVVKKIAEIKGLEEEIVRVQVINNAKNFFSLTL